MVALHAKYTTYRLLGRLLDFRFCCCGRLLHPARECHPAHVCGRCLKLLRFGEANHANGPGNANAELENTETRIASRALDWQLVALDATNEAEIDKCFATVAEWHVDAIVISNDPLLYSRRGQIAEWAIRNRIPTSLPTREQAVSGGIMSCGANICDLLVQAGIYVGRILKGERPANLPILQPTEFECD